jgi:chorismate mutase
MATLHLEDLRCSLIRQEETIIFSLIERAQFKQNLIIYEDGGIPVEEFDGCFSDYLLWATEGIHARVRRYTSPDEHPFSSNLPEPILPPIKSPNSIKPTEINLNVEIQCYYKDNLIPEICAEGDDQNYGSSATCDVACLQALSKRIHFGKFVAEAKFQRDTDTFGTLVKSNDRNGVIDRLTDKEIEEKLLRRVELKAAAYGRDIDPVNDDCGYKIQPETIKHIYQDWIIPMTKKVEAQYLMGRLDD